jgi:hypothetical protein
VLKFNEFFFRCRICVFFFNFRYYEKGKRGGKGGILINGLSIVSTFSDYIVSWIFLQDESWKK